MGHLCMQKSSLHSEKLKCRLLFLTHYSNKATIQHTSCTVACFMTENGQAD